MQVSVIIPTHSRTDMLREAANSVLTQAVAELELIIVPNAATDACVDVAQDLASSHDNIRVIALSRGNAAGARNAGIRAARYDWISFLDDDDRWVPDKLATQFRIASETRADMVGARALAFDENGIIGPLGGAQPSTEDMRAAMTIYNWLGGSSSGALVQKQVLQSVGGFDERLEACEDWDLFRRIAWNHKIVIPDDPLVHYRIHSGSMTRRRVMMARAELRLLLKMAVDSPKDLRPMVLKAWAFYFHRVLYQCVPEGIRHMVRRPS